MPKLQSKKKSEIKFRKIATRIWSDAKYIYRSGSFKTAWIYLLSNPQMMSIGAQRGTLDGIARELAASEPNDEPFYLVVDKAYAKRHGIPDGKADDKEHVRYLAYLKAFHDALYVGMVKYDPKASMIVVPNFQKYNGPTSINVVKAWAMCIPELPDSPLRNQLIEDTLRRLENREFARIFKSMVEKSIGYGKAFGKTFGKEDGKTDENQNSNGTRDKGDRR